MSTGVKDESTASFTSTASRSSGVGVMLDAKSLAKEVISLAIAIAVDMRPPLFSGKAGEDVTAWIRRFETIVTVLE